MVAGVPPSIGTGTGCIPISLLEDHPSLHMHAVDISAGALAIARENAAGHGVLDRLTAHEGDLLLLELPGDDPAPVIAEVTADGAWTEVRIRDDLAGLPRVLIARRV